MERGEAETRFGAMMQRAQSGDSQAYARLMRELMPLLRGRIRRRLGRFASQDAEDVLQDILVSLHVARGTYDPRRPFMPWLMAIARNRLADAAKRSVRRSARETLVEHLPETFPDPEENAYIGGYGDVEALAVAIRELPAGQRQAVELLKLKEMTLREAAASTGMSIPALKVATHRAINRLREVLDGDMRFENG